MGGRCASLRNSRKTECGANQFLTRLAVRAAPFALLGWRLWRLRQLLAA
jgi:hypothetical protein